MPAHIEETSLKQQFGPNPPKQPHRLTPPPLPSGSFNSFDSDERDYNLTKSGEMRNKYGANPYGVINSRDLENKPGRHAQRYYMSSKENPKKMKKLVKRAIANIKNKAGEAFDYDMNMENPYDMGGRPPPGKTERRKKTKEMMEVTLAIRYKRGATPEMKYAEKKIQRVKRELDSDGHEGNMLSELFHPRIPLKKDTLQRTLASHEGGFQTDVAYNDYPILESLVDFDDSKVRKMHALTESSGEYVESDEGERDYLLDPKMTTRDDPFREFVYFSKVKKGFSTTQWVSVENDTSDFSFNPNSSAIEESVDTVGYPPLDCTTNVLQRMMIEDEPHHYDSDYHFVTETLNKLKKRNKKDTRGNKRLAFKKWMSKLVPEHAPHIEKLHDKGIDKLMEQKAHGLKKTYGELFHEHHENKEHEPRHLDIHDGHDGKHEMHHRSHEGQREPHHFEMHGGQEPHHFEMKEHRLSHEGYHESLRAEMHEGHQPNALEEHPEHFEIHGEHEHEPHNLDKEKIDEEHRLKARKKLLEEMYLKEGKEPSNEIKDKHEAEVEETPAAQTAAAPVQQAQQQQYQQQLYQQQQNQMYNQQNQQYNNYGNYGGGGGGMGMNGMGMGGMGMGGMGMGGMGMNGMGGMGMNGMGMGMNGMGMGQMGGFGAILNAVNNNLPKLSQTQAPQPQGGGNYGGPQGTQQNYGGQNPNYGGPNYPQSPAAGPDPNVQAAQDAAAAQQKSADDQEAQVQQPDPQDSTGIQDNKDQDTSQDSSANAKADGSDDDIKADNSNGNDDLNMPSEDAINAQQDNAAADEQNPPLGDLQQNPQFDQGQLGQFGHYDTGVNSANMAAAAGG